MENMDQENKKILTNAPEHLKEKEKKRAIKAEILDWIKTILIGVAAGVILVVFVIQRDNVYGDSMFPTLTDGSIVFTEKVSTYFHKYDRGDIVILDGKNMVGYNHEEYLIKRIVGLPGDTIRIADGHVYLREAGTDDFVILEENYLPEGTITTVMSYGQSMGYDEITLGEDEYYCLGDNRPVSNDSRNLGPFTVNRIKGIAIFQVYPLANFGPL